MRTVLVNSLEQLAAVAGLRTAEDPHEVLQMVDEQIRSHGLEVVLFEAGSDTCVWTIAPRTRGKSVYIIQRELG